MHIDINPRAWWVGLYWVKVKIPSKLTRGDIKYTFYLCVIPCCIFVFSITCKVRGFETIDQKMTREIERDMKFINEP